MCSRRFSLRNRISRAGTVAFVKGRKLLGYTFWFAPDGKVKRAVASKALQRMKERVRRITRRSGGRSIEQVAGQLRGYLPGWREYFRLADTPESSASWINGCDTACARCT